jgi:hypothetical protein
MSDAERIMPDFTGRRYRFHYLTAVNLLDSLGIPLGDIRLRAEGEYENHRGEIRSQDPEPGTPLPPGAVVTLNVGCFSAVDFFPYQFFYGLQGIRETGDSWETDARSIMAPFDAATIRYAAAMRMQTLRYDFGVADGGHLRRFMELFEYRPGDEGRDAGKTSFVAAILPSLHLWGGNPEAVTVVLKRLFGYDVRLKENVKAETPIPEELRYRLGSTASRLGFDTVIGASFEECDSTYVVEFVGVPPGNIRDFLPGGRTRRGAEAFLDYCMPGDLDRAIAVTVERQEARRSAEQYLGLSTYL